MEHSHFGHVIFGFLTSGSEFRHSVVCYMVISVSGELTAFIFKILSERGGSMLAWNCTDLPVNVLSLCARTQFRWLLDLLYCHKRFCLRGCCMVQ